MELFWKAALQGIVQGLTEFLPVSSTGHLILVERFLKLNQSQDFKNLFVVIIQFGSILAVLTLYFHKLNPFSPKKSAREKRDTWTMWFKVIIAMLPAAVAGVLLDNLVESTLSVPFVIALALIVYGVLFILIERQHKTPKIQSIDDMSYRTAFLIGMFQVLSLIPGTSRSGSTILGAVILGTSRSVAAEFSFFLAIPVMFGASLLRGVKFVLENGLALDAGGGWILFVGTAVSYLVSLWAIRFLVGYIRKHDFTAFGYYRIVLGVLVLVYFAITGGLFVLS